MDYLDLKNLNVPSFQRAGIVRTLECTPIIDEFQYPIDTYYYTAHFDVNSAKEMEYKLGNITKEQRRSHKKMETKKPISIRLENENDRKKRLSEKEPKKESKKFSKKATKKVTKKVTKKARK